MGVDGFDVAGVHVDEEESQGHQQENDANYHGCDEDTLHSLEREPSFVANVLEASLWLVLLHLKYSDKIIMKKNPKVILLGETRISLDMQM